MSAITDLITAVDNATNTIAEGLAGEATAITAVATEVADLRAQLENAGVPQEAIDRLSAVETRLSTAAATITANKQALETIGADPANPVPTPAPAPAA